MIMLDCIHVQDLVHFKFPLRSRVMFLTGSTATGKSYFNQLVSVSQLIQSKDAEYTLIPGNQFLSRFVNAIDSSKTYVCVFDEDAELSLDAIRRAYTQYSNIWFVFMRRELLGYTDFKYNKLFRSELSYSLLDLCRLNVADFEELDLSSFGLAGTAPVFQVTTSPMIPWNQLSTPSVIPELFVIEDSKSGYNMLKQASAVPTDSLQGRGNLSTMYRKRSKLYPYLALAFGLASLSGMLEKILDLSGHIRLWDYPSFEGLLLNLVHNVPKEELWLTNGKLLERELAERVMLLYGLSDKDEVKSVDFNDLLSTSQKQLIHNWVYEFTAALYRDQDKPVEEDCTRLFD